MTPKYFFELGEMMGRVEVSDNALGRIDYDQGIRRATNIVRAQTGAGRKVIFVGNGGSAAIASHQAIDYWKNGGIRAIAFNDPAMLTCVGNDFGYPHIFEKPIAMFAGFVEITHLAVCHCIVDTIIAERP